jgi:hypothetical protein
MWFTILFCLAVFGIIGAILIGLGIGIGYLLHALVPDLEIDLAIVAGAVFAVGLLDLIPRFIGMVREAKDEDEKEEFLADDSLVAVPRSWLRPESSSRKSKKRKRRPSDRRQELP